MKLTFISDLHTKYKQVETHLLCGDIIICAGDVSSRGYEHEIRDFCRWFSNLDYKYKVFIAGNHDFLFQTKPQKALEILNNYNIIYLEDNTVNIQGLNIYGTPWQPWFCDWAFNLPRNGEELKEKWDNIPLNTSILVTHSPAFGILDKVIGENIPLGCELLTSKILEVKPKIHICGHIHSGYGYKFDGSTHYFNASVLNEQYVYTQKPWNIEYNVENNEIEFL